MTTTNDPFEFDLGDDLEFIRCRERDAAPGTWVSGTIVGHRFDALVFPEHADNPDYELDESRVSKLWLQRLADKRTVFNWDRGLDVPADTDLAKAIVDFLCAGLADAVYSE
jgi:hypothetical protein